MLLLSACLGCAIGSAAIPRLAHASDGPCAGSAPSVEADAQVDERWPGLADAVRAAFASRDDVDACARIALSARPTSAITIRVSLPDGRSTTRLLIRRAEVLPALEALLLLPRAAAPAIAKDAAADAETIAPPEPPVATPSSAFVPIVAADAPRANPVDTALRKRRARVELSAATSAHVGDGRGSVGLGALSFLEIDGFLAGIEGRVQRYQKLAGGAPEPVLLAAFLGGARLRLRSFSLDLTAGPGVAFQGTTTTETVHVADGGNAGGRASSTSTVGRLLLGSRLTFGANSHWRTFVGLGGEVGPARAEGGQRVADAPRLPVWAMGFSFGATVGTL